MLPDATLPVPGSLASVLACFAPLFTAPSFRTFAMLACGFLAQTGRRTVCGMLAGAGLSRIWPHDRAHWFFARARWDPGDLGLAVATLVVALLVPAGQPVAVAIDDTLFRRRGKKVWAASWFHDGSAAGPAKTGYGKLGHCRHRGQAARNQPPGGGAGAGQAGHQGHQLGLPAVAGPPHGRHAGRRAARPRYPRHR
jgi:DDE superfamily endonuclease